MEGVTKNVWAIVLAAGLSRRMGKPKLMLPYKGKTLLLHVLEQCKQSDVNGVIVVIHPDVAGLAVEAEKGGADLIIPNNKTEEGMSTSLIVGIQSLPNEAEGALFLLGDQPLISANEMNALIESASNHIHPIHQATYYGQKGHPVLFKAEMFPELLKVTGDEGGRSLIKKHMNLVRYTEMNRPSIDDVDTPEQYQVLLSGKRW